VHWENTLTGGPLLDDNAEVVELLKGNLDVAAGAGAILGIDVLRLGNNDHTAIAPGAGRNRGHGLGQILGANLRLLMVRGGLARGGRGIGVNAQRQRVGAGGKKRIGPEVGIMHVGIEAFGGQRNPFQLCPLQIALAGRGLRLTFGVDGGLRDTDHRLFFLAASNNEAGQKQTRAQQIPDASSIIHKEKNNRNARACITAGFQAL